MVHVEHRGDNIECRRLSAEYGGRHGKELGVELGAVLLEIKLFIWKTDAILLLITLLIFGTKSKQNNEPLSKKLDFRW